MSGQRRLSGLSAALRGNGMCLSTRGLRRVPWRTDGMTEDLEYSWLVRIAGGRIAFEPDLMVYATMLSQGGSAAITQQHRWGSGRRLLRWKMLAPLIRSPHLGWLDKVASAIELTMPPGTSMLASFGVLSLLGIVRIPVMLDSQKYGLIAISVVSLSVAILAIGFQLVSPFLLSLLPWRNAWTLLYTPYFMMWKIAMALELARGPGYRQSERLVRSS